MAIDGLLLRDAPARFWSWWTSELADIASIAAPVRRRLSGPDLSVCQNPNDTWVAAANDGRATAIPLVDVIDPSRSQNVRLRLSAADCFVRRVALPNVARREIASLLALDLERATPFKTSEVYSGFIIEQARTRPGFVNVLQVIAPRDAIDAKCADLESLGLRVTEIDCTDADAALSPLNLLTAVAASTSPQSTRRTARWFVPAAIVLAASAVAIDISRHDTANAALVAKTTDALSVAKARRQSSQSAETALAQIAAVQKLADNRISRTRILNELAHLLPDTAWLTDLKIDGDVIDISGHAKQAAALIGLFESSTMFTEAELTSAIMRIETLDRERFSLRARVKPVAAP